MPTGPKAWRNIRAVCCDLASLDQFYSCLVSTDQLPSQVHDQYWTVLIVHNDDEYSQVLKTFSPIFRCLLLSYFRWENEILQYWTLTVVSRPEHRSWPLELVFGGSFKIEYKHGVPEESLPPTNHRMSVLVYRKGLWGYVKIVKHNPPSSDT